MYTIVKTERDLKTYLSNDKINLNSFGSIDNAWFSNDLELAVRLLIKIKRDVDTTDITISIEPYKII